MDAKFKTANGQMLDIRELIREIFSYMKELPENFYKISVGTDSELSGATKHANLVTAVVVHRVGRGARYFWRNMDDGPFHTLRDRIIREVLISIDAARDILSALQAEEKNFSEGESPKWSFEVHADIGREGDTKAMFQEVVGMILGNNFVPQTKPMSYAASSAADRHTS
ncbi:MAG: hypothetical protein UY26_C0005G0003 [Candidatus Jorgensenbacteria bacterium GW2011_GWA1_48_13]|nr:MAG: hypothetical protein UY26_C0005G0003 [Candidatus Jorgensenbacteria bacterium GW2011_GWA1_48_13]